MFATMDRIFIDVARNAIWAIFTAAASAAVGHLEYVFTLDSCENGGVMNILIQSSSFCQGMRRGYELIIRRTNDDEQNDNVLVVLVVLVVLY